MLRTPRHEYGPTAATPATYATPRGNPLGSSTNGLNTPGPSSQPQAFDFLQHPLFADPESLQGGLQFDPLFAKMASFKEQMDQYVEEGCARVDEAKENQSVIREHQLGAIKQAEKEAESEKKSQHELWASK